MDRPSPRAWRGTQTAHWCWLVQKQTTDCSPVAADADIFIQLATAYRRQRKRNSETCLQRGERERFKIKEKESRESVQSCFVADVRDFYTNMHREVAEDAHVHGQTFRLAHKYLCWTEASFPALLYLMHIKYRFPEKIPQCLVFCWAQRDLILITVYRLLLKIGHYHR